MLHSLEDVGGKRVLAFIREKHDASVEKIVGTWPTAFEVSKAKRLGFCDDVSLSQAIGDYIEDSE